MKRIVRLTESDLVKLVKRVIAEQSETEMANAVAVNFKAPGMAPGEAIKMLADNGFLYDTAGRKTTNYNGGLYRFVYSGNEAAATKLKYLVGIIDKAIKSSGARPDVSVAGLGQSYVVDLITGTKPGTYTEFKPGEMMVK